MQKPADDINKTNQISLIEQWFARIIEDIPCMDDDFRKAFKESLLFSILQKKIKSSIILILIFSYYLFLKSAMYRF